MTTQITVAGLVLTTATLLGALPAQAPNWTQRTPGTSPPERNRHAMAFDAERKQTVLFAGRTINSTPLGGTWAWNGNTWTQLSPATSPTPRTGHVMAYDTARKRIVLWGGVSSRGAERQTWEWDGSNWTKIPFGATAKPTARHGDAMVYDASRGVCVLFGGFDVARGLINEVWEYNGAAWTQKANGAVAPAPRRNHAMAYDSARRKVVLFGGDGASGTLDDTWEWDGTRWTQITTATSPTSRRPTNGMVYDSFRRRVVLFGGFDSRGTVPDTWEYDGTDWQQIMTTRMPVGRERASLAFDDNRGRVVLFGGTQGSQETWEYWGTPCAMASDKTNLSITAGGTQTLSLSTGSLHANKPFWIFGSITGTTPGVRLNGIEIPLNIDVYTQIAMQNVNNSPPFVNFRGVLDPNGEARAQFVLPANLVQVSFTLYHAFVVFDASGRFHCASNAVPVTMN